jgi:hypothetical protein
MEPRWILFENVWAKNGSEADPDAAWPRTNLPMKERSYCGETPLFQSLKSLNKKSLFPEEKAFL